MTRPTPGPRRRTLPRALRSSIRAGLLLAAAGPAAAAAQATGPAAADGGAATVIENVTLVDGRGGLPVPDALVVVQDGRIRAAGARADVPFPAGALRMDGAGGFLLPGFVDAHAHVALGPVSLPTVDGSSAASMAAAPEVPRLSLALLLASGITTIRDPGGPAAALVALRDSVARGEVLGPRMAVAGDVIDRTTFEGLVSTVQTTDDVRAEVRRQAAAGVDMIKLYSSLGPDLTAAGIQEAHALGLLAITHPMLTTWTEAARLGIDGIVHILGWSPRMLPPDRRPAFLEMMRGTQFMYGWLELADLDAPELRDAIAAVAARDVVVDPTLVIFERVVRGDDPAITGSPALERVAPALLENWHGGFRFDAGWSADDYRRARAAWPKALELTRRLHEAGAVLAAGTDANNPWVVPGESFHRELELLVEAGIPPLDVLTIATRNGAHAARMLDETGTIEPGKRADLVLLRADPLADIRATRDIAWVMKDGVVHRPAELAPR